MTENGRVAARIDQVLEAVAVHDVALRAFCDLRVDGARADAQRLDGMAVHRQMPLHGVPVAVKEVFDLAGVRCSWGTPIHADRRPAADCDAVLRLKAAGAVLLGTTASTEYAMAREAATGNPYALERSPGASSSGSAAAVAAGLVDLALGTQTIGSGIRPAAYCGVLALKPSHGAISLSGVMPLSAPLDHAVVFARDIDLMAAAWRVLCATSPPVPDQVPTAGGPSLAFVDPWFEEPVDARMLQLVDSAAAHLAGRNLPHLTLPPAVRHEEQDCLETLLAFDMWRLHAADLQTAGTLMSEALTHWLMRGRAISEADYRRALARRNALRTTMSDAVGAWDLLATVATTGVAPPRSEGSGSRAPQRLWTLLGWPAMSVPIGLVEGLPVAIQLVARPGQERRLLAAARRLAPVFELPPPSSWPSDSRARPLEIHPPPFPANQER